MKDNIVEYRFKNSRVMIGTEESIYREGAIITKPALGLSKINMKIK